MSGHRAVFLDRDGTIIRDTNYVARPEEVELLPGAARAIARLHAAGVPVIIITNQSGIERGILSAADYERVHARVLELLAADGASITAAYHCPHAPGAAGEPLCECRKPGPLLYQRAAADYGVDLSASFYAGDKWRDVAAALPFGGTGVLIPADQTSDEDRQRAAASARIAGSLDELASLVLTGE